MLSLNYLKNKWPLSFNNEYEDEFQNEYFNNSLIHIRWGLLLGLLLYSAFAYLDYVVAPELKTQFWFIRFRIIDPLIIIVFSVTFIKNPHTLLKYLLPILVIAGAAGIIAIAI